jgi:hypothetical protein
MMLTRKEGNTMYPQISRRISTVGITLSKDKPISIVEMPKGIKAFLYACGAITGVIGMMKRRL